MIPADSQFSAKRFIFVNALQFWVLAMIVLGFWLGLDQGMRSVAHWLVIASIALLCGFAWAALMWVFFVRPRMERLEQSKFDKS